LIVDVLDVFINFALFCTRARVHDSCSCRVTSCSFDVKKHRATTQLLTDKPCNMLVKALKCLSAYQISNASLQLLQYNSLLINHKWF